MAKVSIIVPIYKVEKYLEKSVGSIINQTYKNLEIILVDDGSPDNCPKMCDDFAKQDKRIKVIHKQNGGLMAAWMDGIKIATGKYVEFVDSDDYIELNSVELLYSTLKKQNADMAICGYNVVYQNKIISCSPFSENLSDTKLLEGDFLQSIKEKSILHINKYFPLFRWNKLFEKKSLEKNLKYCDTRINLGEDSCITLSCFLDSKRIVLVNAPLYNYIQRNNSIVRNYNEKLLSQCEVLVQKTEEVLKDKGYYKKEAMIYEMTRNLFIVTRNFLNSTLSRKEKKQIYKSLQGCFFATEIKNCKDRKFLPRSFRLFLKVFFSKSFFLMNFGMKLMNLKKKLTLKIK